MNIACCGIDREQFHAAEQACGCPVLYLPMHPTGAATFGLPMPCGTAYQSGWR